MPGPADIPMPVPTIDPPLGVGPGLSDPALPGSSLPGAGSSGGYGPGSSIPTSIPPSIPQSRFPRHPTSPSFPTGPTFEQVFQCSGCKRQISQDQSKLDRCPYCNTIWVYKEDGSGRKQVTSGGVRNMVVGAIVGVVIVVLGGVAGFIGIIVAIVRAVSRPARNSYRRY